MERQSHQQNTTHYSEFENITAVSSVLITTVSHMVDYFENSVSDFSKMWRHAGRVLHDIDVVL